MQQWFIATEPFTSREGEKWLKYISWSGLGHLDEVVSLDPMLCPTVLPEIKDEYWPHIVNEDFMLNFFVDLDFLLKAVSGVERMNLLCVHRNPQTPVNSCAGSLTFEFLGYDLVDVEGGASALTNCGGFPAAFDNSEFSPQGLILSHKRALEVPAALRIHYPTEHHADCHLWSISRATGQ